MTGKSIEQHLDNALSIYSQNEYYDIMLKAKKHYFELAGSVDDSEQDYENKMNCFNDWYLLQYPLPRKKRTAMGDYLKKQSVDEQASEAFQNFVTQFFNIWEKVSGDT